MRGPVTTGPTPQRVGALNCANSQSPEGTSPQDFASAGGERKLKASLQANLALAGGFSLIEMADGSYLITRWGLTKTLPDLRAVAAFARQVGGHRHV